MHTHARVSDDADLYICECNCVWTSPRGCLCECSCAHTSVDSRFVELTKLENCKRNVCHRQNVPQGNSAINDPACGRRGLDIVAIGKRGHTTREAIAPSKPDGASTPTWIPTAKSSQPVVQRCGIEHHRLTDEHCYLQTKLIVANNCVGFPELKQVSCTRKNEHRTCS
jgi:hypothetical protein